MSKILTEAEINNFKNDGAIYLKGKFDKSWINKLQKGIERDIKNPSPRFKSHTMEKGVPFRRVVHAFFDTFFDICRIHVRREWSSTVGKVVCD